MHGPFLGRGRHREGFFSNPVPPVVVGAAIGWGIFCATKYCREDNGEGPNGQGGRRASVALANRLAPDGGGRIPSPYREFADVSSFLLIPRLATF